MPSMLRGRGEGEIPSLLRQGLSDAGAPATAISTALSEYVGVRTALDWARAGDLLVLGVHVERGRVLSLVDRLIENEWMAGQPLPMDAPTAAS
jgi:cyanophycin synthetase